MRKLNLTNHVYDRLTVIEFDEVRNKQRYWRCKCVCGSIISVPVGRLRCGGVRSCGCLKTETTSKIRSKHRDKGSKEYNAWCHMKSRCLNPKETAYINYGGRGI